MADPSQSDLQAAQGPPVPVLDPSTNKWHDIPADRLQAAVSEKDGKPGVYIKDTKTGKIHTVPADMTQDAIKAGGELLPLEQQAVKHDGFWSGMADDLKAIASQPWMATGAGLAYAQVKNAVDTIKGAYSEGQQAQKPSDVAYNAVAHAAGNVGVNVPGMEESAKEGDVQGVLGHAATVPAIMAATEAAGHVMPAVAEKSMALVKDSSLPATAEAVAKKVPILKNFVDGPPEDLMTRAVKPNKNNVGWTKAVTEALPANLKPAEAEFGRPVQNIDDALEVTAIAKKNAWKQYQAHQAPGVAMGATIDGNSIADAMVSSIDKRTALQNPGLVEKVKATADTYRRPMSFDEAEDFLQSANKDLNSYYAKNKVGRQVALNDPEMASTVAEAETLRQQLYQRMNETSGPGAAELKRQYGNLLNVERELSGRKLVSDRQQPQSLNEQVSSALGAARIVKGALTGNIPEALSGAAQTQVGNWLKERYSTDALISRAFAKTQAAPTTFPVAPQPRIAGLLNAAPPQLPAPGYTEPKGAPIGTAIGEKEPSSSFQAPSTTGKNPETGRFQKFYTSGTGPQQAGTKLGQLSRVGNETWLWNGKQWMLAGGGAGSMITPEQRAASDVAFNKNYPPEQMKSGMNPVEEATWLQSAFNAKPAEDVGAKVTGEKKGVPRTMAPEVQSERYQPTPNTPEATEWHNEALHMAKTILGDDAPLSEVLKAAAKIQKAGKLRPAQ
jgi:hypothetical protein